MTTYHQVLFAARPADAITDIALQMRGDLVRLGPSEIFARSVAADTDPSVRAFADLPLGAPTDVVIVHSDLGGSEMATEFLRRPERLVLAYHGNSPNQPLTHTDPALTVGRARERDELALLRQRVSIAIADSEFDAGTLVELGYTGVHVAGSVVRPDRLAGLSPDDDTDLELDQSVGVSFVLGIATLLPHNCQHVLLHALHLLQSVHRAELGLVLVGSSPDQQYAQALHQLTHNLRLQHVWFAGSRSNSSLATIHRRARVFSSASRQEGTGWLHPLEAMAFGVPTVIRDGGGTAETVGRGALVLPHTSGPLMFAEALLMVDQDDPVRSSLIDAGFDRIREHLATNSTPSVADVIEAAGLAS